ncbi:hypothetical protein D3C87_2035820 [compost metagenome]
MGFSHRIEVEQPLIDHRLQQAAFGQPGRLAHDFAMMLAAFAGLQRQKREHS